VNLTRRDFAKQLGIGLPLAGVILSQTGCESVTSTLEAVLDATQAAVDIAFPQYAALLNPYFSSVATFIDHTTAELATTDSTADKASKIAGYAAAIISPNLSGVAAEVVTRIAAIAPLIAQLVDEIKGISMAIDATPGGANAFFAAHKNYKPPTAKQLAKIRAKLAALKAKLGQSK
jgi:hypothetical protein